MSLDKKSQPATYGPYPIPDVMLFMLRYCA